MTLEEQLAHATAEYLCLQALWRWKTRQPYTAELIASSPTSDDVLRAHHRVLLLKYDLDPSPQNFINLPMIDPRKFGR
jgi:hypothetical protein